MIYQIPFRRANTSHLHRMDTVDFPLELNRQNTLLTSSLGRLIPTLFSILGSFYPVIYILLINFFACISPVVDKFGRLSLNFVQILTKYVESNLRNYKFKTGLFPIFLINNIRAGFLVTSKFCLILRCNI